MVASFLCAVRVFSFLLLSDVLMSFYSALLVNARAEVADGQLPVATRATRPVITSVSLRHHTVLLGGIGSVPCSFSRANRSGLTRSYVQTQRGSAIVTLRLSAIGSVGPYSLSMTYELRSDRCGMQKVVFALLNECAALLAGRSVNICSRRLLPARLSSPGLSSSVISLDPVSCERIETQEDAPGRDCPDDPAT